MYGVLNRVFKHALGIAASVYVQCCYPEISFYLFVGCCPFGFIVAQRVTSKGVRPDVLHSQAVFPRPRLSI